MTPALEPHSARYFALLYSPPAQQGALEALFGIEREIFESLKPGLDHHVGHSRLQWWREECERTAAGRPVHPLTRTLLDVLGTQSPTPSDTTEPPLPAETPSESTPVGKSPPPSSWDTSRPPPLPADDSRLSGLSGLVDVAVWDLATATFETRREVAAYCERWGTAMLGTIGSGILVDRPILGDRPISGDRRIGGAGAWRTIGASIREIELLADLAREAHYGRVRLPLDELDRAKIEPGALTKTPWPDAAAALLRARHRALRDQITRDLANVDSDRQAALRGLIVWAALACRVSERAERALPNRLQPGRFDPISDAWFAWRVARKATAGRFRSS